MMGMPKRLIDLGNGPLAPFNPIETIHMSLEFSSESALRDAWYALRVLVEAAEDQPWNPKLNKAAKRLDRAMTHLVPRTY